MTLVQRIAQIFSIGFLVFAVIGFFQAGASMEADPAHAPRLLGLFPVNVLHNVVHLLFGVWGLLAARTVNGAVSYARTSGIIYLVLAVLGLIAPSTFGLIPIGGNDIWLHVVLGLGLAAAGFTPAATTTPGARTVA